jgi:protein-S-isoprenylcysteine O-methyltransferase Ste14
MSSNTSLLQSILHNMVVVAVGFGVALIGTGLDALFGISDFRSTLAAAISGLLLTIGVLLRVWAAYHFYQHQMKVISLVPQQKLITSGPYRFSRNPLYLGGNVFIFLGAGLVLGSPAALFITVIHLPLVDIMIRREEKQLEQRFGEEWISYTRQARRWL